ncbi:MAG: amidohydrolase [Clostridiales bacterium]|nr:MAG: amidohydrolase [Clostridiales bacterium]
MQDLEIIDIHAHIFPEKIREKAVDAIGDFYAIPMQRKGSVQDLLRYKKVGIRYFVVHSVATTPKQVLHINDFIYEQMQEHPELIGFATLHPEMEGLEEEIERVIRMGFSGIKLHPDFQQFDIDAACAQKLYSCVANRLPILLHMGDAQKTYSQPKRLAIMAKQFPQQVFIGAHFGGYHAWDEAETYLIGKTNVYIDTSSSLFMLAPERAVEMIHKHGVEKVLFGTDYPMWDPEEELARFMSLSLSKEERRKILYKNATELLKI